MAYKNTKTWDKMVIAGDTNSGFPFYLKLGKDFKMQGDVQLPLKKNLALFFFPISKALLQLHFWGWTVNKGCP